MTPFRLEGRIAFVTGGTAGIGFAIAEAFAGAGARVIVSGLRDAQVASRRLCGPSADQHAGIDADLGIPTERQRIIGQLRELAPFLDIVVLNAAVQHRAGYTDITPEQFDHQVAVNLSASLELITAFAPSMLANGHGRIIAIGSVQEVKPSPQMLVYAALKAAQENLIRNLALQFAGDGVTCNVISPGVIETERSKSALSDPDNRTSWLARIPRHRFGQPEDCAGAALLLASDAGAYITGQTIRIDGGLSIA